MMSDYDKQRVPVCVLHQILAKRQIRLELWHEAQRDGERNLLPACPVLDLTKLLTRDRRILQARGKLRTPLHGQQLREVDACFGEKQRSETRDCYRSMRASDWRLRVRVRHRKMSSRTPGDVPRTLTRSVSACLNHPRPEFLPRVWLSCLQIPAKEAARVIADATAAVVRNKTKSLASHRGHAHRVRLEVDHHRANAAEKRVSPCKQGGLCLGVRHSRRYPGILLVA